MSHDMLNVKGRKQIVQEMTSYVVHKYYCDGDVEAVVRLFDQQLSWIGAGENEFATGTDTVSAIFRQFAGMVPKCNISQEEYHVMELTPEYYVCSGRMWIATDPSTNIYLRQHQRITTVFHFVGEQPKCCHIHISNPYWEMKEDEVGFPTQMSKQSYEYLQEQVAEQKRQIREQTALLKRMSFEDSMTGLFNRNRFNYMIDRYQHQQGTPLGIACFDLNGLKAVNDLYGHMAGDQLICLMAKHIKNAFPGKGYRIGGDEFIVIDEDLDEKTFSDRVYEVCENMKKDQGSCTVGISWHASGGNIQKQFEEADQRMYQAKEQFYEIQKNKKEEDNT